mgnify:CR=1 FL=1
MTEPKNGKRPALVLLACVCVFGALYFGSIVKNCEGSSEQPTGKWGGVNVDDSYVTGSSAERTKSVAERESFSVERPEQEAEAPGEGLSQVMYETLEQPAPLNTKPEVILCKSAFIISYNVSTLCPNYVAWHLTKERIKGGVKRTDEFAEDLSLGEAVRVMSSDYYGSGYDSGHMCPAGDNKNDVRAMSESFLMTNICPQSHALNSGLWNDLENLCREWVRDYSDLYIVAGPIFDSESPKKIGNRKKMRIAVPDRFFKVILMMGREPKAIGFIVPNKPLSGDLRKYAVSVDKVEEITGIDFYPNLPDGVEHKVERQCNPSAWGI